jgi:hypothetical protein
MSSEGKPDLKDRIIQALKQTWDVLNPGGRNPYIAPTDDNMLWIGSYGGDDEAATAFLAMSDEEKLKLVYEVFPAYYPK